MNKKSLPAIDFQHPSLNIAYASSYLTTGISDSTSVPRVVDEHNISGFAKLRNSDKSLLNALLCRWVMHAIIHHDQHIALLESLESD